MDGRTANGRDGARYSVRISDPGELAAAVPHLLGFHPTESVVLISLTGPGGDQVGLTARAGLPPLRYAGQVAAELTRSIGTAHPRAVVVVVVSEAPDVGGREPELPHREMVREVLLALSAVHVPVRDLLLVRSGRWWSYDCPHACCAPGAGTLLPDDAGELAAASVLTGTVVARDREQFAARIAALVGPAAAAMARTCTRVAVEVAEQAAASGPAVVAARTWSAIEEAAHRCRPGAAPGERLADAEVARIICGLRDPVVRDRAMGLAIGADPDGAETLWTECTRRAPAPLDAAPATLLAVSAWLRGDGALANVALDRALAGDPGYRLAGLLASALAACVPPAEIRDLVAGTLAALPDPRDAEV